MTVNTIEAARARLVEIRLEEKEKRGSSGDTFNERIILQELLVAELREEINGDHAVYRAMSNELERQKGLLSAGYNPVRLAEVEVELSVLMRFSLSEFETARIVPD